MSEPRKKSYTDQFDDEFDRMWPMYSKAQLLMMYLEETTNVWFDPEKEWSD